MAIRFRIRHALTDSVTHPRTRTVLAHITNPNPLTHSLTRLLGDTSSGQVTASVRLRVTHTLTDSLPLVLVVHYYGWMDGWMVCYKGES